MSYVEQLWGKEAVQKTEYVIADRSNVQAYAECPFRAWYCREHEVNDTTILTQTGEETHKLAESVIKDGIESQMQPHEIGEDIVEFLPTVRPDVQPHVIRAARYLAESVAHLQFHRIMGVEMQIDDGGKTGIKDRSGRIYKLSACIDLLMTGRESLIVTDWKSGFKKRTNQETFDDFQCQFDVLVLWRLYPDINTIHWFFDETFWGTKSYAKFERNAEYPSLPHLSQEIQFKGRVFSALKLWAEDCREAWPEERKCSWCPIVMDCPHVLAGVKRIASNPKKFIDRMTAISAALDRYKEIAKYWYRAYGPIKGTEMEFDWRPSRAKFTPKLYKHDGNGDTETS
jgi:hypothetical protein